MKTILPARALGTVLLVEDDDATADLEKRALTRSGLEVVRVSSVRAALDALAAQTFGAVLLDYGLPGGDPWLVLELAKRKVPRIPVIVVTGLGSEGIAAEALHRGVGDYVIKDGAYWDRLPTAARRAMNAAQTEHDLLRTNALFRIIAENSSDVIRITTRDGESVYTSPANPKVFGEVRDEDGREMPPQIHPDDAAKVNDVFQSLPHAGANTVTYRRRRADGAYIWVETNVTAFRDPSTGDITHVLDFSRDVSERTRAEARFRSLLESAPDAMVIADQDDKIVLVNAETERLFGHSREDLLGQSVRVLLPVDLRETRSPDSGRLAGSLGVEVMGMRKDGTTVSVEVRLSPLPTEEGDLVVRAIRDVSERQHQRDQRFLLRLGERLHAFTEIGDLIQFVVRELSSYLAVPHCTFTEFDREKDLMTVLGDSRTDERSMMGKSRTITGLPSGLYADHQSGRVLSVPDTQTDPRTAGAFEGTFAPLGIRSYMSAPLMRDGARVAALAIVDSDPRAWTLRETQILQAASERCWLWIEHLRMLRALQDSVAELRTIRGDLERRVEQRTRELQDSLREKEALLKEVHHRVKNNLQVISSLLKLQALHLPDAAARTMFVESQARVQSIALVHEKLYQAKDLSNIPFNEYAHSLILSLLHAQNADGRGIAANLDVAPIHLSVEHAIPCGLILNELVTNSLKHAFPDGRGGSINVMLRRVGAEVQLTVGDDGVGLPERVEPREATSLGLDLVFTFAEQLEATVTIQRSPGTEFRLAFREEGAR